MNGKTKVNIEPLPDNKKISLNDKIFSIGSCFALEIGGYFQNSGIYSLKNPFGTMYNSYSIYKFFEKIYGSKNYKKSDLKFENGVYFSLDHSTQFDSSSELEVLQNINSSQEKTRKYLRNTNVFVITLGTSVVYRYNGDITANNHKLPHKLFTKEILKIQKNIEYLQKIIDLIKSNSGNSKIILTLSPVRHTLTNLTENSYSKSILRAAIEEVVDNNYVFYFPSYEIVLDELRDYSNYCEDFSHLNKNSLDYVMEIFREHYLSNELILFIDRFRKIKKTYDHKVINKGSVSNYKTQISLLSQIESLEKLHSTKVLLWVKLNVVMRLIESFHDNEAVFKIVTDFCSKHKQYVFLEYCLESLNGKINLDNFNCIRPEKNILKRFKGIILLKLLK